ncbi:MAG: UvrD-helicase domain-containing protein [Saccharofermentans sp.]|nr:UvrD-helicase domain-containing protein [Saccharofermentans sp.]
MDNYSVEQLAIINAPIGNTLVSAAAGSGKTTVLVGRIIDKILADEFSVDRILVVTFTKDAAANMKSKIEKKIKSTILQLKAEGGREGDIKKLQEQLDLLPNAYIQTIDSFCSRVIKEKGYVIADSKEAELVEYGNSVLDENTLNILLFDAISQAIIDTYESEDASDEGFLLLTGMFGNGRTDDRLADNIASSYKQLRSLPDYIDRCDSIVRTREELDSAGDIIGLCEVVDNIMTLFDGVDGAYYDALHSMVDNIQFLAKPRDNEIRHEVIHNLLNQMQSFTDNVISVKNNGTVMDVVNAIINRPAIENMVRDGVFVAINSRTESDELVEFSELFGRLAAVISFLSPLINEAKNSIENKKFTSPGGYKDSAAPYVINGEYFSCINVPYDEMLRRQAQRTAVVKAYVKLIKRTDENYSAMKSVVRGMDFPDQSHLAKKILEQNDASEYYREKFQEIYIDEYQDNSDIQDAIIECISRSAGNVFRVGDVKQSIYKFRYANPNMFLNMMKAYEDPTVNGKLFLLNCNYRSDNQVLEFINKIFEQIMTSEGAEIDYNDSQALKYPSTKPVTNDSKTSVFTVEKGELSYEKAEFLGIKAEVERLRSKGHELSDICILTRKHKRASAITRFLNEQGIDAVYSDEVAIFDDHDIHGVMNIIISIGNIYRDEYLLGVLLGAYRYSNFTLGEVGEIILYAKNKGMRPGDHYLYTQLELFCSADEDCLSDEDKDLQARVRAFLDWMTDLRNYQLITDIGELVDRIYRETGICSDSQSLTEKYAMFKEWLCANFMRYGSDIAGIGAAIENMKVKLGGNTSVKAKENAKKNAITCMTYHASKGLEFPAVIVAELYSRTSNSSSGPIQFSPESSFAVNDYYEEDVRIDKSIERLIMDEKGVIEENSEGIRLLYVALTRAMNDLSIILPIDTNANRYKKMYTRLRGLNSTKIPRQYWLTTASGIESAFIAGLLRLTGSSELENIMMTNMELLSGARVKLDYDDFILTYKVPDENDIALVDADDNDVDSLVSSEMDSGDEESAISDDDVVGSDSDFAFETTGLIPLVAEGYDDIGLPIFKDYQYEEASLTPFKMSASQVAKGDFTSAAPINLTVNDLSYFVQKLSGDIGDSASEVGTFIHTILRFIDLERINNGTSSFEDEVDSLVEDGIIRSSDKDKAMTFETGITAFAMSSIGAKLINADINGQACYEKPIVFAVKSGSDMVLIQGIIDLIFKDTDGEYILIDYKTDKFADTISEEERVDETIKRHRAQVNSYAASMTAAGSKVKQKYVFLVRYGEFVKIE